MPDIDASLRAIEDAYRSALPERLRTIAASLAQWEAQPGEEALYAELVRHVHSLAGSAGTFGHAELGARATGLELALNAFHASAHRPPERFVAIAAEVQAFLQWAQASLGQPPAPAVPAPAIPAGRLLYLVHDNALVAQDIAWQIRNFGYEVCIVDELGQLQERVAARPPAAVVMDLGFPTGILAGAAEVARIKKESVHRFAVIFISTRSNFKARLATVRAGADGYFSKPLDMVALVDRLDALMRHEEVTPYRILVVQDGGHEDGQVADALRGAGMEVRVLDRLTELLHVLGEFRPELVLMDVDIPDCSGTDLARLIRQDNMYLDVPIVFLSSAGGFEMQLDAIESGGDDFLSKPIQPMHLVSAVSSRAKRYRALRALIMRDSLTGLYNHSAIKENLIREIARARRAGTPLTLAMVDIDRFKAVNDTYGHPVGDQVIRALSRLLQQRLRRGDIIGRYGGEEFALIMPGTPLDAAAGVLDQVRDSFSQIRHYAEAQDFTSTFSAGLAELGPDIDAEMLFRIADAALYRAKHSGRNCIRG